jgi:TIR domain
MAHDVFVSYSSKDKPVADATCAVLEGRGIRCWMAPRDIVPGADWGESIIDAIQGSRAFVLVFSKNANESVQIKREVERAVNKGMPVIPFRIENVMPVKSLEYFLSTPHWLDAFSPPLERHINYLADVIQSVLDGKPAPQPKKEEEPTHLFAGVDRRVAIAGAAGLLAVAGGGWFLLGSSGPASFVGKWTAEKIDLGPDAPSPFGMFSISIFLKAAVQSGKLTGNLEVSDIGQYKFDWGGDDTGTVQLSGRGNMIFTSDLTHQATNFSFMRIDGANAASAASALGGKSGDSAIAITAPATAQSMLVGTPSGPAGLEGHWYTHTPANGALGAVTTSLDITAGGRYHYRFNIAETGIWQAADGKWSRTPQGALPASGTYQFKGSSRVTCVAASGVTVWTRAS